MFPWYPSPITKRVTLRDTRDTTGVNLWVRSRFNLYWSRSHAYGLICPWNVIWSFLVSMFALKKFNNQCLHLIWFTFSLTYSQECAVPCAMLTLASLAVWKMFVFHNHLPPFTSSWSSADVSKTMIYLPIISGTLKCCSTLRHIAPNVCFSLCLAFLSHAYCRWQAAGLLAGIKGILMKFNFVTDGSAYHWTPRKIQRRILIPSYLPLGAQRC